MSQNIMKMIVGLAIRLVALSTNPKQDSKGDSFSRITSAYNCYCWGASNG